MKLVSIVFVTIFLNANSVLHFKNVRSEEQSMKVCLEVPWDKIMQARHLLGSVNTVLTQKEKEFYISFFTQSTTGVRLYNIGKTPVAYIDIWKAGSEYINNRLIAMNSRNGTFKQKPKYR